MKRVIVDYAKLTNEILNLLVDKFQMVMMIQTLLVLETLKMNWLKQLKYELKTLFI